MVTCCIVGIIEATRGMSVQQTVVAPTAVVFDLLLSCEDFAVEKAQSGFSLPADVEADCGGDIGVVTEEAGPGPYKEIDRQQQTKTTPNPATGCALQGEVVSDGPPVSELQDSGQSFSTGRNLGPTASGISSSSSGSMALMSGPLSDHLDYEFSLLNEQEPYYYSSGKLSSNELQLDQQQYTADEVRTLAQCINRAAAKLEATSTNRVVLNMTPLFIAANQVQDVVYNLLVQSLDMAVAEVNVDAQMAFVVQVGRSLIAQCRESSQLIMSYMKRYAERRFGYRLKAQITRRGLVRVGKAV